MYTTGHSPRPLSLLIVEDNRDGADTLAMFLRLSGHAVRVAHDGEEAFQEVAAEVPDAVLLDIGLPKLDGWQVAERLRATMGTGPLLVALTGYGQECDRERSRRAGFDHHFLKPVDPDAITAILADHAARLAPRA
jgi:CheY-like chemotaxis protein